MVDLLGLISIVDFSIISAALGVIVGVINSIYASRRAERQRQTEIETRQAELFMNIYDKWSSIENNRTRRILEKWEWSDYDDWNEKYSREINPEAYSQFATIAQWFEGIGVLIKRKLIDPTLVDDLMSMSSLWGWETFGPIVKEYRVRRNRPQYYEFWEYLYNEIRAIAYEQHPELET